MLGRYYKPNNTTLLYLNSSFNCKKSSTLSLALTSAGAGYTEAPTITITSAAGDDGANAAATASLTGTPIFNFNIISGGSGYAVGDVINFDNTGTGVITSASGYVFNVAGGWITGIYFYTKGSYTIKAPKIASITSANGTGANITFTLTPTTLGSITMTNNGSGYNKLPTITLSGGGNPGVITGYSGLVGGSGYITPPTVSATGGGGSGFSATAVLPGNSVSSLIITNGGSNYTSTPTIVFTPTNGGSGASATPTINLGTSAVITPSFLRTFQYSWEIPDIEINDLAKLHALNIVATGTSTTTPYTFRIRNLQIDSRNTFFSDYGSPILSIAQNTNIVNVGSVGAGEHAIILTPQTIRQISLSVDDSITTKDTGVLAGINFVIALEIIEFNPTYQEKTDVYQEAYANRLRPLF